MINSTYWINTPVGYNLDDHLNVRSTFQNAVPYVSDERQDRHRYLTSKHQLL
jgi:hypothetical protein